MPEKPSNFHFSFEESPLYQKGMAISDLATSIAEIAIKEAEDNPVDPTKEIWKSYASFLIEDSYLIPAKIAGAIEMDLYDLKMENATIIRKAARDIILHLRGLEMTGFKDVEYLDIIRREIEDFRILFAEWVKTFDEWDYIIDRWGLFNPPGINYDDEESDDEDMDDPYGFFYEEDDEEWDNLDEEDFGEGDDDDDDEEEEEEEDKKEGY